MFLSETALIISVAQLCEGIMINLFVIDVTSKFLKEQTTDHSKTLDTTFQYMQLIIISNHEVMKSINI